MFNSYMLVNAQWHNPYTRYHCSACVRGFTHICVVRVRTEYPFSLCVVSLLSSRFTARAVVWLCNLLKRLGLQFFISLITVDLHGCLCTEFIGECCILSAGGFRCWNL
jgi:hypothetical protein